MKRSPTFTVDFRQINWEPIRRSERALTGLRQHVNSRTNTFHRKSILVDLSQPGSTETLISGIGSIMPQRADLHFLIIGGDIKYINESSLHFGGINMTALADIALDSVALKTYKTELNPRIRGNDVVNGNLSYNAALLIDGMKSLIQTLRLLNEDSYSGQYRPLDLQSDSTSTHSSNLPCQPSSPAPFNAPLMMEKLQQISFPGLTGNISFDKNGFRNAYNFEIWGAKMKQSFSNLGEWNSKNGVVMKTETDLNATQGSFDLNRVRIVSSILVISRKKRLILWPFSLSGVELSAFLEIFEVFKNLAANSQSSNRNFQDVKGMEKKDSNSQ
ncbi:unnamed protein product [Rodentolepis nana]|uniref:ANF_receptor domain-containing protein n=1 Tax=Rodentolepis nana TaxID=102285 RepID=A0A0R3T896_RODNA|nr:unnamed protein product [Rodentolepis nana]